jgi:FkbM family methyltransferase
MAIQRFLKSRGYRIERIVDFGEGQIDVFELVLGGLDPQKADFTFVQIGANDGSSDDPINKYIKRYEWRGVLLEPQAAQFEKLEREYQDQPQLSLVNAALAISDGELCMYTIKGSNGLLATFDKDKLKASVKHPRDIVELRVRGISVPTLLKQCSVSHIDLLVVDTEGFDYQVVKMFLESLEDLPKAIRYEHLLLSDEDRRACVQLLQQNGYQMLRDGIDTIAIFRPSDAG